MKLKTGLLLVVLALLSGCVPQVTPGVEANPTGSVAPSSSGTATPTISSATPTVTPDTPATNSPQVPDGPKTAKEFKEVLEGRGIFSPEITTALVSLDDEELQAAGKVLADATTRLDWSSSRYRDFCKNFYAADIRMTAPTASLGAINHLLDEC
ncbi:MAG: hypothetical protein FWG47_06220, partial [Propionibacteriaceae bacterium]|nr:hypothetical protein [Propionibacteriaceae bacterium]